MADISCLLPFRPRFTVALLTACFLLLNCKSWPWCFHWLCATGACTGSQQVATKQSWWDLWKAKPSKRVMLSYPPRSACLQAGINPQRVSQGGAAVGIYVSNAQAATRKVNSLHFTGCSKREKSGSHQWLSVLAPAGCCLLSPCSFHCGFLWAAAPWLMLEGLNNKSSCICIMRWPHSFLRSLTHVWAELHYWHIIFYEVLVKRIHWLTVAGLRLWASLTAPVSVSGLSAQCLGNKPDFWECFT